MAASRFLIVNNKPHTGDIPPISTLLELLPGAYTTTRTHANASILLFWDRHLRRLSNSVRLLSDHRPDLLGGPISSDHSTIQTLVGESLRKGLGLALAERDEITELAVTALVCSGSGSGSGALDVYLHIGFYVPQVFGAVGARLAIAGRGRDVAEAKYSQWARMRKNLERMRPPLVTELLLSNDGDRILEGSVSNFFVVCKAEYGEPNDSTYNFDKESAFELQTAPTSDGVLPGVMRQIVIEVCSSLGIPVREVSPSWSDRELWKEAFITSGLRLMQHVESVQAPIPCKDFHLKSWNEVYWEVKRFEGIGLVTSQIQVEILSRIESDAYPVSKIC